MAIPFDKDYHEKIKAKESQSKPQYVSPSGSVIRTGKCSNPFKSLYEQGHDPLSPFIEFKCPDTGAIKRKAPESKSCYITDLTDKEIGDYLTKDELKQARQYAKERKENEGRDICKEKREEKEREEKAKEDRLAVLEAREAVWLQDAKQKEREFADYKAKTEERLNKLASLVSQLLPK